MYSSAKTILLDDVLAALEYVSLSLWTALVLITSSNYSVHTSKWIVDKCFSGDLAKGRTIILVVRPYPCSARSAQCSLDIDAQHYALRTDRQLCRIYQRWSRRQPRKPQRGAQV